MRRHCLDKSCYDIYQFYIYLMPWLRSCTARDLYGRLQKTLYHKMPFLTYYLPLKSTVPLQLWSLKFVSVLGRFMGNSNIIFESLPGIVTSYQDNLLKPKVCNNLRLSAANFTNNIQVIDWAMMISLWWLIKACIYIKTPRNWRTLFKVFILIL